jgi:hypothetical protein
MLREFLNDEMGAKMNEIRRIIGTILVMLPLAAMAGCSGSGSDSGTGTGTGSDSTGANKSGSLTGSGK